MERPEAECLKNRARRPSSLPSHSPSHSVSDREGEGCGLGLAIVREIALAHDASVDVGEGRAGRGARFTVRFSAASRLAAV